MSSETDSALTCVYARREALTCVYTDRLENGPFRGPSSRRWWETCDALTCVYVEAAAAGAERASELRLDAPIDTFLDGRDGLEGECLWRLHTLEGVDDVDASRPRHERCRARVVGRLSLTRLGVQPRELPHITPNAASSAPGAAGKPAKWKARDLDGATGRAGTYSPRNRAEKGAFRRDMGGCAADRGVAR
jgi:hypothetical protein